MIASEFRQKLIEVLKTSRSQAKQRKFIQSWDLTINFKDMDMKKPENKIVEDLTLPHDTGKKVATCMIADALAMKAQGIFDRVIKKDELASINPKTAKNLAEGTDFFFSEISLMPMVGKVFGSTLAPKNKMPKPVAPNADLAMIAERTKKTVRIKAKDAPVISMLIGREDSKEEDVADNVMFVLDYLEKKLPKGKDNIRGIIIKLTMGKPVKLRVV